MPRTNSSLNRTRNYHHSHVGLCSLTLATLLVTGFALPQGADAQGKKKPAIQTEATPQGRTKRVIVKPFAPPQRSADAYWRPIGDEVADMLITALVEKGIDVIERKNLDVQGNEEGLDLDGTGDSKTYAKSGGVLGGQYAIVGRISEFGYSSKGGGLGGIIGIREKVARVKLDGRLMEIRTGRIIAAAHGEGTEKTNDVNFLPLGNINFQSEEWLDSQLGKAARKAIDDLAKRLAPKVPMATGTDEQPVEETSATPSPVESVTNLPGLAALRKKTVVVLIPEVHLARPRVPDPAAETEIVKCLLKAGIRVKDEPRLKELREERWVREMAHGQLNAQKLEELRTRYGADILIVGEGISERTERTNPNVQAVVCRGRVELKAIRMDTGDIIASEAEQSPGRDLSEVLASKAAFTTAGKAIAPRLIAAMAENLAHGAVSARSDTTTLEMEITGFGKLTQANDFLEALGRIQGIRKSEMKEWRGGVLFATIEAERAASRKIALWLETHKDLKSFGITVGNSSDVKIQGTARKRTLSAGR